MTLSLSYCLLQSGINTSINLYRVNVSINTRINQENHPIGTSILLTLTISLLLSFFSTIIPIAAFATTETIETVKLNTRVIEYPPEDYDIPAATLLNFSAAGEICPTNNNCFGTLESGSLTAIILEDGTLTRF